MIITRRTQERTLDSLIKCNACLRSFSEIDIVFGNEATITIRLCRNCMLLLGEEMIANITGSYQ